MKNFKFTEVATATDNITLVVIGKLALNGPRSIFKNVTGAEEISFEVEEEDTYESISTIVRSFTLMDGLNLVVVKYHGGECVKKIIDEIFENEMEWHNLDIGGNYLAFARSSYEHKEKSINILFYSKKCRIKIIDEIINRAKLCGNKFTDEKGEDIYKTF